MDQSERSIVGIDTLYNRLWTRPSLASIRWLHLLVALGAVLSTLMLFPSTIGNQNEIYTSTASTGTLWLRNGTQIFIPSL